MPPAASAAHLSWSTLVAQGAVFVKRGVIVGVEAAASRGAKLARSMFEAATIATGDDDAGAPRVVGARFPARCRRSPTMMMGSSEEPLGPWPGSSRSRSDRVARRSDVLRSASSAAAWDLREAGEGLNGVAEHVERNVGADRQRGLLQPLARFRTEGVSARQALTVAQQRQEAVGLRIRVCVRGGLDLASTARSR